MGGISKFSVSGGTPPHSPSMENPGGFIRKTRYAHYVSGVKGFMQILPSFLISLVVTSTAWPRLHSSFIFVKL